MSKSRRVVRTIFRFWPGMATSRACINLRLYNWLCNGKLRVRVPSCKVVKGVEEDSRGRQKHNKSWSQKIERRDEIYKCNFTTWQTESTQPDLEACLLSDPGVCKEMSAKNFQTSKAPCAIGLTCVSRSCQTGSWAPHQRRQRRLAAVCSELAFCRSTRRFRLLALLRLATCRSE